LRLLTLVRWAHAPVCFVIYQKPASFRFFFRPGDLCSPSPHETGTSFPLFTRFPPTALFPNFFGCFRLRPVHSSLPTDKGQVPPHHSGRFSGRSFFFKDLSRTVPVTLPGTFVFFLVSSMVLVRAMSTSCLLRAFP